MSVRDPRPEGPGSDSVLAALCEVVPDCALLCRRDGHVIHANRPARELLGSTDAPLDELLVPEAGSDGLAPFVAGRGASAGVSYLAAVARPDQGGRIVRVTLREVPLPEPLGGPAVLVVIRSREDTLTDMEALEAEVSARGDFPTLLAGVARHFLNLAFSEVETGIHRSLSALGRVTHAQRAFLYLIDERGMVLERAFGWNRNGSGQRSISDVEGMSMDQFPWTVSHFMKGETVLVSDPSMLPPEAEAERALCEYLDVQGYVNVPLRLRGRLAGWIGLDDARPRVWSEEEVGMLRATGGLLLSAWEGKRRDEQLFIEQERAQRTLDCIGDGVISVDNRGRIEYVNPVAERLLAIGAADARGKVLEDVLQIRGDGEGGLLDVLGDAASAPPAEQEGSLVDPSGQERIVLLSVAPLHDRGNEVVGAVLALRDVTEARESAREAEHHANHDALTGLVNRREFERRLVRAMESAAQRNHVHALCFLDLDNFKSVNDTAGHAAGDAALSQVAELMLRRLRSRDTLARLGGDEFGLLLEDCDAADAWEVCSSLVAALEETSFEWRGETFRIGVSIGITAIDADSESTSKLLTEADQACYRAKALGRGRVQVFGPGLREPLSDRAARLSVKHLEEAVSDGLVDLLWQPVRAVGRQNRVLYREILCRIFGPDGEALDPEVYLPVARRHALLPALDCLALESGLGQAVRLSEKGALGFNVTKEAFCDPASRADLERVVTGSAIPKERIWFELREASILEAFADAKRLVEPLSNAGCRIIIAGVQGGLGTLHLVEQLPVHALKVGGAMVGSEGTIEGADAVLQSLAVLAGVRDIPLIANDVASAEQARRLAKLGVGFVQGDLVGRAAPLRELEPAAET